MDPAAEIKQEIKEDVEMTSEIQQNEMTDEEPEPPGKSDEPQAKPSAPAESGDDDFYEEEMMLLVDFGKCMKLEEMQNTKSMHIEVIGIDSESPFILVNDKIYRGSYDTSFGTNVFFEKDPERTATLDPVFEKNIKQMYRYVDKSDKVLRMKRIFATPKENAFVNELREALASSDEEAADEKYEIDMTYEDALNLHLPDGGFPPRHISDRENGASLVRMSVRHISAPKADELPGPSQR